MSLLLLFTQAEALGVVKKVVSSLPWGGGLRVQSRFSPRLWPWETRIKFSLLELKEVACELNLASHIG